MTRTARRLLTATAWLVPALLVAGPSVARASYLHFVEVQRDNQNGVDGLQGIEGVAVSPDGRHVYASSDDESALAVFSRNPATGALTFVQVKKDGVGGVDGLRDAQTVSLSPDGLFVYVAGRLDNAIAVFRRDAGSGAVTFVQAVKNGAAGVTGLTGPKHVIISPDGAHAYAAGHDDNSLVVFQRDQTSGKLTFLQKETDGADGADGLAEVRALAISPDGATVYAASKLDDAVSVFRRDPSSGLLTFIQVLKDGVAGVDGLAKTRSVTVSPDGDNVYSTGGDDDALAVFHRDQATGRLTFLQMMRDGVGGVDGLNDAQWATVSPDGTHVLATGQIDDAVAVFARDPDTGRLTFVEVQRDDVNGVDGINGAEPVAFSPDGSTVYVGGHTENALAVFHLACGDGVLDAGEQCDDGNMLGGDCCSSTCHFEAAGTSCPDDDNACTDDVCDPTGSCTHPANTDPCDDGAFCTVGDTCRNGLCQGATRDCAGAATDQCQTGVCDEATDRCVARAKTDGTTCDDANACTQADACHAGTCSGTARPNGSACNDGTACTRADSCQAGTCTGANPVVCAAPDQCHTAGTCDPGTGICSNPAKADGTTCDDANACTQGDACRAGACAGTARPNGSACNDGNACTQADACQAGTCVGANPVVCAAPDQCHTAGSCNPSTGTCSNPAKTDGTTCDDGNACTQADACQAGTCAGAARPNGTPCTDGNGCTQSDTCQAGTCTAGSPVVCTAQDQCHTAGTCNPATGTCSSPAKPDGATCDDANTCTAMDACRAGTCAGTARPDGTACTDGDGCTRLDTCHAGTCTGGDPVVCTAPDQCHDAGTCDPATGTCANPAKPDGTRCDDANACTDADACHAGACAGTAQPNGSSCNDGNACTLTDACQAGTCVGASPVVCIAQDQCHTAGSCNPSTGTCSNPASTDGATCDDGNACTQANTCQAGTCTAGNPIVCTAQDQCHAAGTCNPATGVCANPAKPDGAPCDDGDACTRSDTCHATVCTGGNPVVCAAQDQCHAAGTCAPGTGMCSNPEKADGTRCDDGDACTQSDACTTGSCTGTDPIVCTARDQCHDAGTCDHVTGACSEPAKTDGSACDDGNACTRADACAAGACAGSDPIPCAAADQCHDAGSCDPSTGRCSNPARPDGATCDDGNTCTDGDACTAGLCAGPARPDGATCDDGNGCTQTDTCQAGFCVGGNPMVCTARDACHLAAAACDPATGACPDVLAPDDTPCDDGDACTRDDRCRTGACTSGQPITCPAPDSCHAAGVCDTATGRCMNPVVPDGTSCDDGSFCTTGDVCLAGVCTGGAMPDRDEDGVCDLVDVCPDIPNPDQLDTDHNGVGDVCECTQPPPGRCIGGGGSRKLDCMLEFNTTGPVTYNRKHTRVKRILRCADGDPTCDLDGTPDGTCTFGVSACLSNRDPRFPRCHMSGPLAFEVVTPKTTTKNKLDMMNMWALEEMLRATGLEIRRHDALYTPGQAVTTPDLCSPLIHLMVPAPATHSTKPVRRRFRVRTTVPATTRDRDRFVLECRR